MKRIELPQAQPEPNFIGSWLIEQAALCEELIAFFEAQQANQTQGQTASGVNLESKNSIDLAIRPKELAQADHDPVRRYIEALFDCHRDYIEQWPFLRDILPRAEIGTFNIQKYLPGGHFLKLHSERTTIGTSHRVLAWMTYLNDVEDGGSTSFHHQGLAVRPEQGKTLIWPGEWTHAHRGEVVNSGVKYIITGWLHFPPDR
ncbi:MAG: prolyl 4-hydroxylase subunit alpha [Pseudohongiella sp.]|nr:MAG: prolyl 4-hydroxylase subunit alpha [Pseudohongiella sp.]